MPDRKFWAPVWLFCSLRLFYRTFSNIEINFQNAQAQAKKLEDIADNMKHLADQQMADTIREMSSCWRGEAAAAYFGKAEKVKQDIMDTAIWRFLWRSQLIIAD